jgi:hypothetical protein
MSTFQINANGSFAPGDAGSLPMGTAITFSLAGGATDTTVYVFSGTPLTADATLFGSASVTVASGGTIQDTAAPGATYTLSTRSDGSGPGNAQIQVEIPFFGEAGGIRVGGG